MSVLPGDEEFIDLSTSHEPETGCVERDVRAVPATESPVKLGEDPVGHGKQGREREKKFPVIEIFGPVIQGEGSQAGNQTMFIRFGGCDYRCQKCDSLHAVIPEAIQKHARYLTTEYIFTTLQEAHRTTGVRWVTFSGGNPCMHKLGDLVEALIATGWYINVETQGTLWQDWLHQCHLVTVSPKAPGMGEKFDVAVFQKFIRKLDVRPICVKVPVFFEADLEMAISVEKATEEAFADLDMMPGWVSFYLSLGNPYPPVLNDEFDLVDHFDTVDHHTPLPGLPSVLLTHYRRMSEEVLQDRRLKSWRFLPQLHVLVYGNETGR
jgi:7-carboxy-7-deazaguanine synthase